ncbi:MAG: hypothetical protein ACWA6Y_06250 [Polaromonas sp.]
MTQVIPHGFKADLSLIFTLEARLRIICEQHKAQRRTACKVYHRQALAMRTVNPTRTRLKPISSPAAIMPTPDRHFAGKESKRCTGPTG